MPHPAANPQRGALAPASDNAFNNPPIKSPAKQTTSPATPVNVLIDLKSSQSNFLKS